MKTIVLCAIGLTVTAVLLGASASADIYVAGTGVDAPGNGTLASPYRTITYALANRGGDTVIRVGVGLYTDDNDDVDDETFPLTVPAGVSVIGTMGSLRDDTDSAVVNAGGAAKAFVLATSTSGTATFSNLVITNFIGPAIDLTGWRGTIDGCYITGSVAGSTNALVFLHLPLSSEATDPTRPIDLRVTNTVMENLVNAGAKHVLLFSINGNGKTYFTNCTFKDITVGTPDRGSFNWEWVNVNYDVQLTNVLIDHIVTNAQNGAQYGIVYTANSVAILDRCTVRNINSNTSIINSNKTLTVRDSLFYNLTGTSWGAMYASNGNTVNAYNCTFDGCSAVTNTSGGQRNLYNCSISNCTTINADPGNTNLRMHFVNVYNTPYGPYDADNSNNLTAWEPKYRDPASGDYHLRGNSLLVDAGNNADVAWTTPVDIDGNARILDGNFDATATVDIGADEFTTSPAAPTFSVRPFFHVFAGSTIDIPVSIVPSAGASVDADVAYDTGLTGAPVLTITDGTGPAALTVAVDGATGTATGNPMDISFTVAAGPDVLPADCTVVSYTNTVTLAGSTKVFLTSGAGIDLPVKLMSSELAAPADIPIAVGTPAGTGTNSISWVGGALIPQGAAQSAGMLSITAASGLNTVQLTVGGGFVFDETGTDTLDLQVVCLSSPIYVSGAGSDTDGIGTEASPLRSITKALTFVPDVMEIQVGPGLYDAVNGETFRITVPEGVSITGTRGPVDDEFDSSIIDAGGAGEVFRLRDTAAGTTGLISGLVIRNFIGPAINLTCWRGTIDNCYITGGVAGGTPPSSSITRPARSISPSPTP